MWKVRNACWMPKATATHSEYVILTAFPRTRLSVRLYVQSMPCLRAYHSTQLKTRRRGTELYRRAIE